MGYPLQSYNQTYFKSNNITGFPVNQKCNSTNQCVQGTCCTFFNYFNQYSYQQCSDPDLFQVNYFMMQNGYEQYCVDSQSLLFALNYQRAISSNQSGLAESQPCVTNSQCIKGSCCTILSKYNNIQKYCLIPGSNNFTQYQQSGYQLQCSQQNQFTSNNKSGLNQLSQCQNNDDCSIGTCCTIMQQENSLISEQRCIDPDIFSQLYYYGYTTLQCINSMTYSQYSNLTSYNKYSLSYFNVSLSFNLQGSPETSSCNFTNQCIFGSCCTQSNQCIIPYQFYYYIYQQSTLYSQQCSDSIYNPQLEQIIGFELYNYCFTNDSINCFTQPFNSFISYDGSYCITNDSLKCTYTYGGSSCNPQTDDYCIQQQGNNKILSLDCLTFDGNSCYFDGGYYCTQSDGSNVCNQSYSLISFCQSIDGYNCYDFNKGWYFTYDGIFISAQNQLSSSVGSYCFSNDYQYSCNQSYGLDCNQITGHNCFNQLVSYCVTYNNYTCYKDQGLLCNSKSKYCKMNQTKFQSCATYDGLYCQNFNLLGWYLTIDGQNVYEQQQINGYQAIYCISYNGIYCKQDFGIYCDMESGSYCSYDKAGIVYEYGSYCATLDNNTCCLSQLSSPFNIYQNQLCDVKFNDLNFQSCFTQDGVNCYNINQGFCFTIDGINCIQYEYSDDLGSYCWSNDGNTCSSYGLDYCSALDGPNCNVQNNFTQPYSYCITSDNQTCMKDDGQYCNNSYNIMSCNVNNEIAQTCLTTDTLTCNLTVQVTTFNVNYKFERQALRDYFFYATIGKVNNDTSQVGVCDPDCLYYSDTCCVAVKTRNITGQQAIFDNICMNKFVAKSQMQIQLSGQYYNLRCQSPNQQLTEAIKGFQIVSAFILASICAYMSI